MTLRGVEKLPIAVKDSVALKIYIKVSEINGKLGKMNSELSHAIINDNFINIMSMRESLESTKIEGTQVTFDELLDEKMDRKQRNEVKEVLNYLDALNYGYDKLKIRICQ
ncbi:Fic/DOC family N-terminal domain-containing protein [Staphylococcus aureus]|uniref:Fic/DOC family N-terminal domain-containing protein n=1 Tax=Staphylococcus aureus TaxID=1280 RepID=UPI001D11EABA|nr:Fic/DOC family N-terminal domain-containing protein [Staphylococcus aureus]